MKSVPELQDICDFLNEIRELDPAAIELLLHQRVPCNAGLAAYPKIQVRSEPGGSNTTIGLLGVINGLASLFGGKIIAVYRGDAGQSGLLGFYTECEMQRRHDAAECRWWPLANSEPIPENMRPKKSDG